MLLEALIVDCGASSTMVDQTKAPVMTGDATDYAAFFETMGRELSTVLAVTRDPFMKSILETILKLDNRIATFFLRIREIIKIKTRDRKIQFVIDYFFKNFSIISENMRASRVILNYVLKKLDWLRMHSERIIESLKTLYTDLLTMQIDCEELYRAMFGKDLDFDFGLDSRLEKLVVSQAVTSTSAYEILELGESATREQVKAAFRKKAKHLHPDLNPDARREEFVAVEAAYKLLLAIVRT
jgi:hypothetical protein